MMSEQVEYTRGPWQWVKRQGKDPHAYVFGGDYINEGEPDMCCKVISADPDADARRIAACLNACDGVPTAALTPGVVQEAIGALQALVDGSYRMTSASENEELWQRAERVLAKVRGDAGPDDG